MPVRTIAIGDVHGCDSALQGLVRAIAPQPDDRLIALGDYIDRGPDSRRVIETLIALSKQCRLIPLMGNHEIMMLTALEEPSQIDFWLQYGGAQTLASYGVDPSQLDELPAAHLEFLSHCLNYYETDGHIFVHANYAAHLPLDRQPEYALFWEHLTSRLPERHVSGKVAIVGHTPQSDGELLDLGHVKCIDTFCFGGGWLTALDVDTGRVWQVDRDGHLRVD